MDTSLLAVIALRLYSKPNTHILHIAQSACSITVCLQQQIAGEGIETIDSARMHMLEAHRHT